MHDTLIEGFQLSPQQRHLWLLAQHDDLFAATAQSAVLLEGPLDVERLRAALQQVVEQHEILRTTFRLLPGMPVPLQVIGDAALAWAAAHDLRDLPAQAQMAAFDRLFDQTYQQPIDCGQEPVLHGSLVTFADDRHALLLRVPALCADRRTLTNLTARLSTAYAALGPASATELDEPIQYVVVSDWLNELLESEDAEPGKKYWRQHAFVNAQVGRLPFEQTQASAASEAHAPIRVALPEDLVLAIEAAAQQHDTTLHAFLLACWQVLLWRLTGSAEIVVGAAFDGRTDEELAQTLGLFTKYLPVSSQPRGDLRFAALLQQLAREMTDAAAWQECFAWDDFAAPGLTDAKRQTLAFGFDLEPCADRYTAGQLIFQPYRQRANTDQFSVKLACSRTNAGLEAFLEYDSRLFARADIERMGRSFATLVTAATRDVQSPISRLEILDPQDRRQVLEAFNPQPTDAPIDRCLPELFAEQVARMPEQVALVLDDQTLTYAELNSRANRLARHLQSLGVGPEVFVALYLERSVEMIVALLAVLKAGGVYTPLDPAYPQERLGRILDQMEPPVILTQQHLAARLPSSAAQVVCLDADLELPGDDTPLVSRILPQNLAYVIFTSGSTGMPKGVTVSHEAITSHCLAARDHYALTPDDRMLQFAVFHFDASLDQILPPLLSGATIVLRGKDVWDAATCARIISEQNVSVINLPTAYWHQITREWATTAAPRRHCLRLAIIGGEALLPEYLRMWHGMFGASVQVLNAYGPTEAAITATTCSVFDQAADSFDQGVAIGSPLGQRSAYILDRYGNPVPIGVVGELYLGGMSLARGYLGQPDLTAERFLPDPFSQRPGVRLYKTGDLARYLPDGRIMFIGRADRQVKVRGFRIELSEIEAAISRHLAVGETIVLARQTADHAADKHLVAYVVAAPGQTVTAAELRDFLTRSLPDYMVPGDLAFLDSFPLTPNGKVDRAALPDLETLKAAQRHSYVAPRTVVEESLAEIWADVFNLERVGVYDNFFDLGGHSLLATQLIARVRSVLQVEVSLRSLMNAPTIAGLARIVEQALRESRGVAAPPLVPLPRAGTMFPPSFAQQRLWFLQQFEPDSPAYNMPGRIRIRGALNQTALIGSLAEIIRRHEALRTTFALVDGQPVQIVAPSIEWEVAQEDLRHLLPKDRAARVAELTAIDAARLFDLQHGPLLRATLLRRDETEYVLLLTMHHIVADERSVNIFVQELSELYEAFTAGKSSALPDLALHYADYAIWQRSWLQGAALDAQMAYWKAQLQGAPALLALPTDRPRPATQTFRGASHPLRLSESLTSALKTLSRQHETTLFMTLLAAFQVLLARYSGQDDIVVGSPIVSRTQTETEGLIGCFINTLVLRANLSGDPSFREALARVREATLGAYAHQDLPFEKLVEELQPERNLSYAPLFQVLFTLQHQAVTELKLPDLELSIEPVANDTTKFDLTLMLVDGETIGGSLEYNTDLFDAATIERLIGHFATLLEAVCANPDQSIWSLPLLTADERSWLLRCSTGATLPFDDECMHNLVARHATATPTATALIWQSEQISYAELQSRAERLAVRLRARGIGPEHVVGVYLERTPALVVALVAILKAGSAYVALDPSYPQERLIMIAEDAGLAAIVTQADLVERLAAFDVPTMLADEPASVESAPFPLARSHSHNLAYLIYTSGSTGRPKGVSITHRSAVGFIRWAQSVFSPEELAGVLAATSVSFDLSIFEIFVPLSSGGTVILADHALALPTLPSRDRVTLINTVPSAMAELLRQQAVPHSVRTVNLAGEALRSSLAQTLYDSTQVARLNNLYGPSETTTYSTWTSVPRAADQEPSIGRPVANTQVYVLDRRLNPAPVGVPGELYIGGVGVARGYLNRPSLTAERFIPDPFAAAPGARLYRTGDLVRWQVDGCLEFLGRADHQVKVRGFRIEPGEIEAVLRQHEAVREAVVIARDERLVAYIVQNQDRKPDGSTSPRGNPVLGSADLRAFLRDRLPDYMVPSVFVLLDTLPLNSNGKIDRKALPAPDADRGELTAQYVAPRTPLETELARIWAEVLGVEQVGIYDNFFDLGGHSLKAIQTLSWISDTLQVEVSLHRLFQSPVIADFAQVVEQTERRPASPSPIKPLSRQARRVSVDAQSGLTLPEGSDSGITQA